MTKNVSREKWASPLRSTKFAEEALEGVALPRACLPEIIALLGAHRIRSEVRDERFVGTPIDVEFRGGLRPL
jgi:hypothetical protein